MKKTNFEISKKLKEAGFVAQSEFYFAVKGNLEPVPYEVLHKTSFLDYDLDLLLPTYDLETILDTLRAKGHISLFCGSRTAGICFNDKVNVYLQENESLADTAGRLWLLLKEKGLV